MTVGMIINNLMDGTALKYNFSNFALISQDVEKRNYFYRKTAALLERKADLDLNYAHSLESLITRDFLKTTDNKIASQCLYAKLVTILQEEPRRVRSMAQCLKEEAEQMTMAIDFESAELKKSLETAQRISKQILSQREKLQRSKVRYDRKKEELELSKIRYLGCVIGTEQLQRTNDLYLSVSGLEEAVKPLFEDYKHLSGRFQQSINRMVEQFDGILLKLEEMQSKKIRKIKFAVTRYAKMTKMNLDEVMVRYPFLCEEIDRVRELEEFVPHSEHSLILEGEELNNLPLNEFDYIDSIYDRIEKRKDLEEIILYGQTPEHKKNLTSSVMDPLNEQLELSPKTLRMVEIFKAVFEGASNEHMIYELKTLFENDEKGRKDFILLLQQFRINNEFELNLSSKLCITKCLLAFLDVCHSELDTYNSKMLMVLSLTYHFNEDKGKVELQELIRDHEIWKRVDWWQAALLEKIYEETRVKGKFKEVPVRIWDIKAGGISRKEEGEEETYQYICFNQMLFFVKNMSFFPLDYDQIIQYARVNISLLRFTGKLAKDIMDLCPTRESPTFSKKDSPSP